MIASANESNEQSIAAVLKPILGRLNSVSKEIEASAVMTRDGLTLASKIRDDVNQDRLGAMCASLLSLSDKTAKELSRGKLKQVLLEGDQGCVLIVHIGQRAVLAVVSKPSSNLGMVFVEARKVARDIEA
ncbi:MAG: roadblock/LC7 domain-containing protein, partial [Gammaproteobacteria bacterium]